MIHLARPAHPGTFFRMEVLEPLDITVTEAARALGVTRQALSAFLNANATLSPAMAIRIEKAFGVKMDTLMRMQAAWDIAEARRKAATIDVAPYRSAGVRSRQGGPGAAGPP